MRAESFPDVVQEKPPDKESRHGVYAQVVNARSCCAGLTVITQRAEKAADVEARGIVRLATSLNTMSPVPRKIIPPPVGGTIFSITISPKISANREPTAGDHKASSTKTS